LVQGEVQVSDLKELDIEDLLGRDPVPPDPELLAKNINRKVVMVTGAGGSIGSELCRQIVLEGPSVLLLLEITEFALYAIEQELQSLISKGAHPDVRLVSILANVRDASRMDEILRTWKPHTLYHAAAYKHVPLVEHNPAEGVMNNVLGTLNTARLASTHGVADFVLISTDKAVRPTNVMGASKRLSELVLQAQAALLRDQGDQTRFSMVRFGNVLGSSGSVVPLFRQQIQEGGPITLTDERITRYFMTIPEAAQLVIQAGAMASGGDVFLLDMGEPVKIIDLAKRMVELSGLTLKDAANPNGDIAIEVTGLRPGEKLYEELLIGDNALPTHHPRIMKAHEDFLPWDALQAKLLALELALQANNVQMIQTMLQELVPGYQPNGEVVDWVWMERARLAEIKPPL
jgi:FlaA1/EpsC-like NDP-sugar epimerase